ncbi:MAG: PqqD family protein [bacterium]
MRSLFGKRRSRWAGIDFFTLIPEQIMEYQRDEAAGTVALLVPRFRSGPLGRWLQPRLRPERANIRVTLEERGSWIWDRIDGESSVGQIAATFREVFPTEQDQVDERICVYLVNLETNGFVRFANLPG